MTKDEALRLALEALEKTQSALARCIGPHKSEEGDRHRALAYSRTTITAIKAALEKKDEPEYYGLTKDHLWMSISKEHYDRLKPEFRMACYTIPPPVAEPHKRPSRSDIKPLTDEEIDTIGATIFKAEFLDDTEVKSNRELARAIEAAHGIKGTEV